MARVFFITGGTYGVSFFIPYNIGQYNFNISLNCPRVVFSISQVIFDIYCHFQSHFLYKLPIYFASNWNATTHVGTILNYPPGSVDDRSFWVCSLVPIGSKDLKCTNVRTVAYLAMDSYSKGWYSSDKMKLVKTGLWTEDKKGSRDLRKGFKIFRGINCYFIFPTIP